MKKFAVLGYPAKQSKSPKIFSFLKEKFDLNFDYETLEIKPDDFKSSLSALQSYDGLNITSPYKNKILEITHKESPEVELLKAANVIKKVDGRFEAFNTDVYGFKESLKPFDLMEESVLVMGSSGAARAAILGLYQMGLKDIYVKARNYKDLKTFDVPFQIYTNQKPQVVIQATTIGLNGNPDGEEFFNIDYSNVKLAYDLIYSPKETVFMKYAQKNNVEHILNGEDMLVLQALNTFDIWFGLTGEKRSNILESLKEIL